MPPPRLPAPRPQPQQGRLAPGAGRALTQTEQATRQRAVPEQQREAARCEVARREAELPVLSV
jgi:translation initiation factor IF-2